MSRHELISLTGLRISNSLSPERKGYRADFYTLVAPFRIVLASGAAGPNSLSDSLADTFAISNYGHRR